MAKTLKLSSIIQVLFLCVFLNGSVVGAEGFTFTRNMTLGSRGADVSALQQILIDSGFLKIIAPTGYFGPLTKSTLSAWQASLGISPASGFFGSISREKIKTANSPVASTPPNTNTRGVVAGCISFVGFSPTTGQPCSTSEVSTTLPSGCISTTGFSTTTGHPCKTPEPSAPIVASTTTDVSASNTATSVAIASTRDGSPVRLKIPRISVDAGFQANGLKADGSMEIPNNVVDVGWFTGSVHPGDIGTSVITGHVAQIRGGVLTKPGVFFSLKDLSVGDTLTVVNDKGETTSFVVREIRSYDPGADATDVFAAKDSGRHMNIITCEGTWHPDQLSYSQRLVVFTDAI